ncbi:MAG: IclR family transcriptional regulator [Hylemonella sp.]
MKLVQALAPDSSDFLGDTPALRLFALLELMAGRDRLYTLQDLVEETGYPKPTLHRMLGQLEAAGLLQREHDGRHYGTGVRLRQLAENLLLNNSLNSARHRVLRQLVEELGESCNITTLMGGEVVYLDRVETAAPLRFYLHPGSRVPAHCSASGKLFLAQMSPAQRRKLLAYAPLQSYTPKTLVKLSALEQEFRQIRHDGYAFDNEEFLPGLICLAVGVPSQQGRASVCVAVQAPILRCSRAQALDWLPALQKAATALGQIGTDASDSATPSKPSTLATALS